MIVFAELLARRLMICSFPAMNYSPIWSISLHPLTAWIVLSTPRSHGEKDAIIQLNVNIPS